MSPNEYQRLAKRTLLDKPEKSLSDEEIMQVWTATGLAGEAGEILDYIKKGIFHQHGVGKNRLQDELGDQLWYLTMLAEQFELTLEDIMAANIAKLQKRYPDGFNSADSKKRNVENEKAFADALAKF